MTNTGFRGTGVAIITPFRKDESIDFDSFARIINYQIDNKVDYIVLLGTTGESPTILADERQAMIDFAAETIDKRIPLVVGIGGNSTHETLKKIKETDLSNASGLLSVCPYYSKPSQRGVYEHYKAIAHNSPVPIILYNVPGRTGINMCSETTLKLANDFKNIIAMKEASGNMTQIMDIIRNKPKGFLLISGDDMITLPIIAAGGDGIISVIANAFPRDFSEMVRLALNYKMEEAQTLHYKLFDLMIQLFADGNPGGIKAALSVKGLCENNLRLPLVPVNDKVFESIKALTLKAN